MEDKFWKQIVWQQFGAAIDMLENAIHACPEKVWSDSSKKPEWLKNDVVGFWYLVYHTLFWLDFYLSESQEGFQPPAPFNLDEFDPVGLLPERPYTKDELLRYLEHGRRKCRARIAGLTDEGARERRKLGSMEGTFAELLLSNLRHVQHHTAQLNLILRQETDSAPNWVRRSKTPL
jgi:hypothetical protein